MSSPRFVALTLLAVAVGQALTYYPQLPTTVASHFDAAGTPNGWAPKDAFFGMYAVVLAVLVTVFAVLQSVLGRIPDALINLPHKDYWLAPIRRAQTLAALSERLEWIGVATLALVVATIQLAIQANLGRKHQLPPTMWVLLAGYILFSLVWTVRILVAFRRPSDTSLETNGPPRP